MTPLVVEDLSFQYRARAEAALQHVSFTLQEGELLLVAGPSGCGKTTLARCVNGLIPHSYRGQRQGSVRVLGQELTELPMARLSQVVGTLLQDPERQIVASTVEGEVAFGPENLGLPVDEVNARTAEALARLGLEGIRHRDTASLSGGEKQKVALAGLLALRPAILILDEPLASLDPRTSREALRVFRQLAREGTSILLIEHRVEDVLAVEPDRVLYLEEGRVAYAGDVEGLYREVEPGQIKLPAEVAMRRARELGRGRAPAPRPERRGAPLLVFEGVGFHYPEGPEVLRGVDLEIGAGEVVAVLGPNGAGKSTLLKQAIGLLKPDRGRVLLGGRDTRQLTVAQIARRLGYVFQSPSQMLFAATVSEELAFGPRNLGYLPAEIQGLIGHSVSAVGLQGLEAHSPLALSFGQQKRLTIGCVLAMRSGLLALDEPTAGQDYGHYTDFMHTLVGSLDGRGIEALLFITHDLDLAIGYATRVLLLSEGRLVADGPPEAVLADPRLLERCHLVPTSLLQANLERLPRTGRFLPTEALARF